MLDNQPFTCVLVSDFNLQNLPKPADSRIEIHVQREKHFAVLRFGGRTTQQDVKKKQDELLEITSKNKLRTRGKPFLMRYNSPFMPGLLRTNEIGIEILPGK